MRQFGLVIVVWIHACIGLHFAWRLRPWYRDWLPTLYAVALLVPAAGIGGAAVALRDFADLAPSSPASSPTSSNSCMRPTRKASRHST